MASEEASLRRRCRETPETCRALGLGNEVRRPSVDVGPKRLTSAMPVRSCSLVFR